MYRVLISCLMLVIYESPLFVGQHSKRVLRHSLWNDTLLLARMNVMDYSLVIGINEENKELILGIIGTENGDFAELQTSSGHLHGTRSSRAGSKNEVS